MDSTTQLALMSKAKKVFGKDDTFLCFPISRLAYTKRQLDFYSQDNADDLRQSYRNLEEFSTLVNLIPIDETWPPVGMNYLWDIYHQILKEANLASSTRTPDEEARYQQARAYLHEADNKDSAPVRAYNQCKDAYLFAEQKYKDAKITAECSTDSNEKQRWKDVDEPALRKNLDMLEKEWIAEGYKYEVETARSIEATLGARSPFLTWDEWNSRYNPSIDSLTGESNTLTVFPSTFSPYNALEEGSWVTFKLSEEEIKVLLNEAPEELRARLSADITASSTKSVTFEFSSAGVIRSWFMPEVFRARFWRFADATRVVSSGGMPPSGVCPAYVTAVVFARKISVEEKQTRSGEESTKSSFDGFSDTSLLRKIKKPEGELSSAKLDKVNTKARLLKLEGAEVTSPKLANMKVVGLSMSKETVINNALMRPEFSQKTSPRLLLDLREKSVPRLPQVSPQVTAAASSTSTSQPSQPVQDNTIYILAFICKALPKCPDPDPTLQW